MFKKVITLMFISATLIVSGCAAPPLGPSMGVQIQPAPGKSTERYMEDIANCKQHALNGIGGQAAVDQVNQQAATNALVGIGTGVLAGALIGSAGGDAGGGAQVGGASGLLVGTAVGANVSQQGNMSLQGQYDEIFKACMSTKGNLVAGYQGTTTTTVRTVVVGGGNDIIEAQQALRDLEYYNGKVDGVMGRGTRDAIWLFQTDQHLRVTGHLDDATMTLLRNR